MRREDGGLEEDGAGGILNKVGGNKFEVGGMEEEGMVEEGGRTGDGKGETKGERLGRSDGVDSIGGRMN